MIKYEIHDSNEDYEIANIYCLFCGVSVGPDKDGDFGDCKHLRLNCTKESLEHPETSKENFFEGFDEENDWHLDFLEKKLVDKYFMLIISSGGPQTLEAYFLFCHFPD